MRLHLVGLLAAEMVLLCCGRVAAGPLWTESVVVTNIYGQQVDSLSGADNTAPGVINYSNLQSNGQVVSQVNTIGGIRPLADVQGHIDGTLDPYNLNSPTEVISQAYIRYSFVVVPKQAGTPDRGPIPVRYSTQGSVTWSGSQDIGNVTASVTLTVDGNQAAELIAGTNAGTSGATPPNLEFNYPNSLLGYVPVGSEHTFELLAFGDASLNSTLFSASGDFQAVLDPQVFIDPSFPFANEFTFAFNTRYVTQAPQAVPEPSGLMILLGGLGPLLLSARWWRRRRDPQPPDGFGISGRWR